MIQREWLPCTIYHLSNRADEYGQPRKYWDEGRDSEIFLRPYSERTTNNPVYQDSEYIGLIKEQIDSSYLIVVGSEKFRVLYNIPSIKYNQVFLKKTLESPVHN